MRRHALIRFSLAAAVAGGMLLSGCNQTAQTVKDAATTAATGAAQTALGPAVAPVLDLLKQAQEKVAAGDLAGADSAMGGFQGIWDKAAPVIKPLAGDRWASLESAAKSLSSTFSQGTPSSAEAGAAISGLLGPLSALSGK